LAKLDNTEKTKKKKKEATPKTTESRKMVGEKVEKIQIKLLGKREGGKISKGEKKTKQKDNHEGGRGGFRRTISRKKNRAGLRGLRTKGKGDIRKQTWGKNGNQRTAEVKGGQQRTRPKRKRERNEISHWEVDLGGFRRREDAKARMVSSKELLRKRRKKRGGKEEQTQGIRKIK